MPNQKTSARLRGLFSQYLGPKVDHVPFDRDLQVREIEVVLIMVRGDSAREVCDRMGTVADIVGRYGGDVSSMFSAIVIAVFGSLEVAGPGDPGAMAAAVQDALPTSSKLLRFKGMAHVGPFGSDSRADYTFLQPAFPRFLATFLEMSFGEFRVA